MRTTTLSIILLALVAVLVAQAPDSTNVAADTLEIVLPETVRIVGVGDVMPGSDFPDRSKFPAGNGAHLIHPDLLEIIRNADIAFCNLEGSIGDGIPTKKGKKYAFRIPTVLGERLEAWGFDLISIANNHAGDCEDAGRHSTMKCLEYQGLTYSGSLFTPAGVTCEKDGVTYGFIALAPNKGCNNFHNTAQIEQEIRNLDSRSDIVIVSIHGGAEGAEAQHLPKAMEIYMDEKRGNMYEMAHRYVDCGADIVFGHGPHVTRAIECYNGRLIAYSLGNFCTHGGFNLSGVNGLAPIIEVETDREGKLISGQIHSAHQVWPGGPVPDEKNRVLQRIIELTDEDLDGGGLEFRGSFFFPVE